MGSIAEWMPTFAPRDPTLWPRMLLPIGRRSVLPYPFSSPNVRFTYLSRNGIYGAVKALDLVGQEVLMPSYFHGIEVETLLAAGARLKFYPVRDGMRVDPEDVVAAITAETRAVFVIPYAGFPGPIGEIEAVCRQRGLLLIEDCAMALLTTVDDRPLGSFGDASTYCLYKWLPVPNGGALVLNAGDPTLLPAWDHAPTGSGLGLASLSLMTSLAVRGGAIGRAVMRFGRVAGRRFSRASGVKYIAVGSQHLYESRLPMGMSPLSHWILARQNFAKIAERRRANYELLSQLLADVAPPVTGPLLPGVVPYHYPVRFENKQTAIQLLHERGVEAVNYWQTYPPVYETGDFPETDELRRTVVDLPIHQDLSRRAIERLARVVREVAVPHERTLAVKTRLGTALTTEG
ncbi:MAG: perosamine synthetase [Thermomicrobiales bacterium]|nr:perosamine synthetase [Thermomicrobiales bacterium]